MTDNEITREKTFSEELSYFKERMKEVYDYYDNPKGCAEMLYIDVLSVSNRVVQKAEEEIIRQQAEIERLNSVNDEKFNQWNMLAEKTKQHYADLYNEAKDILKAEAVKEFAEKLKNKIKIECNPYCKPTFDYDTGLAITHYIENLVKEKVDNEKGESKTMNKIFYLFIFADNSTYEMNCAVSFKDAVLEMAKNTGNSSDMFCKCLTAYKDDEIDGIIELFNHFCSYDYDRISKIYIVDKKIFDSEE